MTSPPVPPAGGGQQGCTALLDLPQRESLACGRCSGACGTCGYAPAGCSTTRSRLPSAPLAQAGRARPGRRPGALCLCRPGGGPGGPDVPGIPPPARHRRAAQLPDRWGAWGTVPGPRGGLVPGLPSTLAPMQRVYCCEGRGSRPTGEPRQLGAPISAGRRAASSAWHAPMPPSLRPGHTASWLALNAFPCLSRASVCASTCAAALYYAPVAEKVTQSAQLRDGLPEIEPIKLSHKTAHSRRGLTSEQEASGCCHGRHATNLRLLSVHSLPPTPCRRCIACEPSLTSLPALSPRSADAALPVVCRLWQRGRGARGCSAPGARLRRRPRTGCEIPAAGKAAKPLDVTSTGRRMRVLCCNRSIAVQGPAAVRMCPSCASTRAAAAASLADAPRRACVCLEEATTAARSARPLTTCSGFCPATPAGGGCRGQRRHGPPGQHVRQRARRSAGQRHGAVLVPQRRRPG